MKKALFSLLACSMLAGCLDAEMNVTFRGDETVEISQVTTMDRQSYDMLEGRVELCSSGEKIVTVPAVVCEQRSRVPLAEASARAESKEASGTMGGLSIKDLGNGKAEVTFDIGAAISEAADLEADAPERHTQFEIQMMRAMLSGHSFTFTVTAEKILSTNGEVSMDGRRASSNIPLTVVLDGDLADIPPFVTVVKVGDACLFQILC